MDDFFFVIYIDGATIRKSNLHGDILRFVITIDFTVAYSTCTPPFRSGLNGGFFFVIDIDIPHIHKCCQYLLSKQ